MNWKTYFAAVGTFIALSVVGAMVQRKSMKKLLANLPVSQPTK